MFMQFQAQEEENFDDFWHIFWQLKLIMWSQSKDSPFNRVVEVGTYLILEMKKERQ